MKINSHLYLKSFCHFNKICFINKVFMDSEFNSIRSYTKWVLIKLDLNFLNN